MACLICAINGVSAENLDGIDDSNLSIGSTYINEFSTVENSDNSESSFSVNKMELSSYNNILSDDSVDIKASNNKNSIKDSGSSNVSVNVKVNYEYPSDSSQVVPDFYVVSNGNYLNFTKAYDFNKKAYVLNINGPLEDSYNITALTSGYIDQSKVISGSLISELVTFDLKATAAYKLGKDVTAAADKALNFKDADDILVVTTAGVAKLNGKSSEEAIEGILNYGNIIDYTDILMLRQSALDPIDFAFIIKKGNQLKAVIFENGSTKQSYLGTISENMTRKEWNNYYNAIKGVNAWSFASLANGWVAGVSREVLQEGAFHGHICEGTLGGYSIVQALLKYYPPVKETQTEGVGSPGDVTSYKILGVPGGSDDDAAIFFLDATIGKTGYVGVDTTATGATENMIGFIRWYARNNTGDLIIMSLNSTNVKKIFTKEIGINPDDGSLEELKYCSWWINKINNDPGCLVDFLYEFTALNADQYYYLMGTSTDVNVAEHSVQAIDAHGLDMEYILSLNLPKATRSNIETIKATLTDDQMKQIGINAANIGKSLFKEELGIDIDRDAVDFAVFTSAGYVYLDGQETVKVRDGLYESLGTSLYSKNMLQYHQALWKPLWFAFILRHPDTKEVHAAYLRYNSDGTFFIGDLEGDKVIDIGINTLNDSAKLRKIEKTFAPDGNWFSVQTIANAWRSHPVFEQILSFLYHNHVCPGVQPGFFITDHIESNYPLGENESYTYIASTTFCKDDSMTYLLGISPGMGTFLVKKLPKNETVSEYVDGGTYQGVLVVWDDNLKVGKATILSFKWGNIDTSMYGTSEAKRATQIEAYIDLYNGVNNPNIKASPVVSTDCEKWITEEQFNMLKTGVGDENVIRYIQGLDNVTKEDLLKAMENNTNIENSSNSDSKSKGTSTNNNSNFNSNSNTNSNSNSNSNSNTNSNSNSNSNSNTNSNSNSNGVVSTPSHKPSHYTSVGTFGAVATASPNEDGLSEDTNPDNPSDASSYEVSKTSATKSADSNALIYAIIGVLAIGILLGLGYIRRK
ncbi:Protein containing a metal-binding domain shared with formylmethanofuran dehydrogenase subunit E [Methanobrevibacter olleyae]|uniref:Protein containing a metal-binding domain shared with formylmethanofuran dehydrogenase subunit E n=1 Tax=Methanobrevibacter olleyae TaxID=294671 RepID=A0A1I4J1S1_METOL|nr:FmdE family protein [Methanobrevibacter olleyae]SFL60608.1 Protein containing a metal-binding domain shared with formylmethanofuran dehydrogenase subunit E [Methanobrevibacter olleyae]